MTDSLIEYLLEHRGIESQYLDAWDKPTSISDTTKRKLLSLMGYKVTEQDVLAQQVQQEFNHVWLSPLNPVQVLRGAQGLQIVVRLPLELVTDEYCSVVTTEQGKQLKHTFSPIDGQLTNVVHIDEVEFQEYICDIPIALPMGYHQLSLQIDDDELASMRLIVTPERCFTPPVLEQGKKLWGLSVQLYCLRSDHNWGIGDFSDLSYLIEQAAKNGADFVGLNPIHALFPQNPNGCSPYGPSSRRWLNFLYIDVTRLDGYTDDSVQSVVNDPLFQTLLDEVRATDWVDYVKVTELKLNALKAIFAYQQIKYFSNNSKLNKAFKSFVADGGDSLQTLATYDALQAHFAEQGAESGGWADFPKDYANIDSKSVKRFAKKYRQQVTFYMWLQWQAAIQLAQANDVAKAQNMSIGLYRDLAVGVSDGGAEIWGNQELYCAGASVGAPPDVLGPQGQTWGLPPMDPEKLYQQQYQPIVELFQANMRDTGALRIDHVMALLRLWWVPRDSSAKEGGYVYYPVDDLLGILALESQRNQSLVIGEDLGTVPDEIRSKLAENGIFSYRVFFFEQAPDGGFFSPAHYPEQSMATLTTHDMATLNGYWHCDDLRLGKELGLYPDEEVLAGLYASRHREKQAILDSLHGHQVIDDRVGQHVDSVGMSEALNHGLQLHMANGSSDLLTLQLEDWLQMDKPVNVPGTFKEYPNWRRKLSKSLQALFNDESLLNLTSAISDARSQASTKN